MKKIGMIVAIEIRSLVNKYADRLAEEKVKGFKVYSIDFGEHIIYVTQSGAGEIKAAACTQMLIDLFDAELMNGIPNMLIKTVSDSIHGGAEEFVACAEKAATVCLSVVDRIMKGTL